MTTQISTIEQNPELVNLAYELGSNFLRTCENALKEAIRRLQGSNLDYASVRNAEIAIHRLYSKIMTISLSE